MHTRIIKSLSFVVLLMALAISGSLVHAQMDHSMPPGSTGITPQPFYLVERAKSWVEDVNNEVHKVQQYPPALLNTLNMVNPYSDLFQL